ncbi:MAG: GlxA family transcriptional regulator, partial [Paracoccaceae bacterium]|nr:GlxA family transcriptional regulator [Paracoccaceae bacterium]
MSIEPQIVEVDHKGKPRRFVFVLMQDFTMLSFAAAIESLRIANRMAGKELYTWV